MRSASVGDSVSAEKSRERVERAGNWSRSNKAMGNNHAQPGGEGPGALLKRDVRVGRVASRGFEGPCEGPGLDMRAGCAHRLPVWFEEGGRSKGCAQTPRRREAQLLASQRGTAPRLPASSSSLDRGDGHANRIFCMSSQPRVVFCFHDGTSGLTDSSSCQQSTVPAPFPARLRCGAQQRSRGWELIQEPSAYLPDEDLTRAKREVMGSEMPSAGN